MNNAQIQATSPSKSPVDSFTAHMLLWLAVVAISLPIELLTVGSFFRYQSAASWAMALGLLAVAFVLSYTDDENMLDDAANEILA